MKTTEEEIDMWGNVYVIYTVATLLVLAVSLDVRLHNQASSQELIRSRGYELPPFRLLIHTLHAALWMVCLAAVVTAVRYGAAAFGEYRGAYGWTLLATVVLAAGTGILGYHAYVELVRIDDNRPPTVAVTGTPQVGIRRQHLARLGVEQFPERIAYEETDDLKWRFALIGGGGAVLALRIGAASDWGRDHGLYDAGNRLIEWFAGIIPVLPREAAFVLGVSAALALLLLVVFNGTYTLMPFPATLKAAAGMTVVALWCAGSLDGDPIGVGTLAVLIWFAFSVRWGYDLVRAFRFKDVRGVTRPIAIRIAQATPYLAELRDRADCQLEVLDKTALSRRITHGCRNVEEASVLVTRNFARFLSLVNVEREHFSAAMLRYLTVRRYLTRVGGGGTRRPLQDPVVPLWNELLFPLRSPEEFRNWLDPLPLGSQWDIVRTCGGCGGSGQVTCSGCGGSGRQTRTETYTQYAGGKSATRTRSVTVTCAGCSGSGRVTCGTCSGMGRLVYHQTLNTQWQYLVAARTAPHVELPELMEGAEERIYYRVPLVENRAELSLRPEHDGIDPDLETQLTASIDAMSADRQRFRRSVETLHDGILYRSDFQVTGFYVIRIAFERLRGQAGWFFGRRPEFYFPKLPLGWSMVCTVIFVLPFVVMTAVLAVNAAQRLFNALPPIY
jgi:hypothetical protein